MKTGLVMEGGAMRGMFTAGVLDVLMEHHITFDGAIGVSAGAVFGCNFKSKQIGRAIRYNKRFCNDPRYVGLRSLLTTGDLYNEHFCYQVVPYELDPFDVEAFAANPMPFYVVCTDAVTGKPVYHRCDYGDRRDIRWFQASASMPLVSRVVKVDGMQLLDGGVSDSIPICAFRDMGYERNVVILTQPRGYLKKKNPMVPLMRLALRKCPRIVDTMAARHLEYNETTAYLEQLEQQGDTLVIRPEAPLGISRTEKDPEKLQIVYDLGRKAAKKHLNELIAFLGK